MKHIKEASWIRSPRNFLGSVTTFSRKISFDKDIKKAYLEASALGVYAAYINGKKVGDAYLAPGWTEYAERIQVETCDVTAMLNAWACGTRAVTAASEAMPKSHARRADRASCDGCIDGAAHTLPGDCASHCARSARNLGRWRTQSPSVPG